MAGLDRQVCRSLFRRLIETGFLEQGVRGMFSAAHRILSHRDLGSNEMVKTKKMPSTPRATQRTAKTHVVPPVPADHIRRRAYGLFQARGSAHGHDVEDWVVAEADLLAGKNAEIVTTSVKTQRRLR